MSYLRRNRIGDWFKKAPHIQLGIIRGLCLLLALIASGQIQLASAQTEMNTAYEAVIKGKKWGNSTILYVRGKYSIQNGDRILVCDNANPPARWSVDMKTKTAQLDYQFVILQLLDRIKKEGIGSTAERIHVAPSLLTRFKRQCRSYVPRNLDLTLRRINPTAPGFRSAFQQTGVEKVAERSCSIYHSRVVPEHTIWVDTASKYVLKERTIYPSDNPRIPPFRSETEVIRFQIMPSIDPKRLQIPAGVTAVLPRFLAEISLPTGVNRQVIEGKNEIFGFDLKRLLDASEKSDPHLGQPQKAKEMKDIRFLGTLRTAL